MDTKCDIQLLRQENAQVSGTCGEMGWCDGPRLDKNWDLLQGNDMASKANQVQYKLLSLYVALPIVKTALKEKRINLNIVNIVTYVQWDDFCASSLAWGWGTEHVASESHLICLRGRSTAHLCIQPSLSCLIFSAGADR
jgi:hypothetical protein